METVEAVLAAAEVKTGQGRSEGAVPEPVKDFGRDEAEIRG